jgi:hypothetical protein
VATGPKRLLRWIVKDIKEGDNADLWLLSVAAVAFTILGALGIVTEQALASLILALLAVLAISQIRTRQVLTASRTSGSSTVLHTGFPDAYYALRASTQRDWLYIGNSMSRTFTTGRLDIERIVKSGGTVRILLPDPRHLPLIAMIEQGKRVPEGVDLVVRNIESALAKAVALKTAVGGAIEIRTTKTLPKIGINLLDSGTARGAVMVQLYEYKALSEPAPILYLEAWDGYWYNHFRSLAERLWDDSIPWSP